MRTPGPLQLQQHHPCFKLQLRHKADRTSSAIGASRPRALRHLWMNRPRFPSPSSCRPYRGEQTCRASDYHRPWPRKRHSDRRDCFTLLNIKTFTIGSLAVHCAAPETRRGFPGLNRGVWVSFPRMGGQSRRSRPATPPFASVAFPSVQAKLCGRVLAFGKLRQSLSIRKSYRYYVMLQVSAWYAC